MCACCQPLQGSACWGPNQYYLLAACVHPEDRTCCPMQVSCSTKRLRTQLNGAYAPRLTLSICRQHLRPEALAPGLLMVLMTWRWAET